MKIVLKFQPQTLNAIRHTSIYYAYILENFIFGLAANIYCLYAKQMMI